jgi:hypothetical protein
MKKILGYNNFLTEKYEEDPEFRIKKVLDELTKNINYWFKEGVFSANEAELFDINVDTSNNVEKYLIFDFQDNEYYYQVQVIITLQEVEEEQLDECYVKVKRYDIESSELLREYSEDVKLKNLNEDKIIQLISKLDEKSDSLVEDEDEEVLLSDEDSDLEDTDIA